MQRLSLLTDGRKDTAKVQQGSQQKPVVAKKEVEKKEVPIWIRHPSLIEKKNSSNIIQHPSELHG